MGHIYSADFYDYINAGSRASARAVIPLLRSVMRIDSMLDIGAGVGAWAAEWLASGTSDVVAIDGSYVERNALLVPTECFITHDLSTPLALYRRFDLVQSLEVAEHIAPDRADLFIDTLTGHGDVILFSAAAPGQGGEHHVNEQRPEYWRRKFAARGFDAFDWLRPLLADCADVQPWYKYNSVIYANAKGQQRLAAEPLAARIADHRPVKSRGSLAWYTRRVVVSLMPVPIATRIAALNAQRKARMARKLIEGALR